MANAQLSLCLTENREQGGKVAGVVDCGCRQSMTGSKLKQAGHKLHRGTTASVAGSLSPPAHLTVYPEKRSAWQKATWQFRFLAGQEQKGRLRNQSYTHLWPSRPDKHLQTVYKCKLPGITSTWVREVLLSQWHSAPQVEKKQKSLTFTERTVAVRETCYTSFPEHHSGKEAITCLTRPSFSLSVFPCDDTSTMGLPRYHFLAPLLCPPA